MPGTSGVVGEFLFFCGAFQSNTCVAFFAATGVILGAAYMLYLYRRVVFGPLVRDDLKNIADLSRREIAIMVPLVVMVMWMGIYPNAFLGPMHVTVEALLESTARAAPAVPAFGADDRRSVV